MTHPFPRRKHLFTQRRVTVVQTQFLITEWIIQNNTFTLYLMDDTINLYFCYFNTFKDKNTLILNIKM